MVQEIEDGIEFFKIETGMKPPQKGINGVVQEILKNLGFIFNNMQEGQSVVSRDVSLGTLRIWLKENHPEKKIAFQVLNKEKKWFRLFLKSKGINKLKKAQ